MRSPIISLLRSLPRARGQARLPLRALSSAGSGGPPLLRHPHGLGHARLLSTSPLIYNGAGAAERFEFQAETKSLLDIVARSLYSEREVFVRELVSNASDALEKRRIAEISDGQAPGQTSAEYELRIDTDSKANTLTFRYDALGL